MEGSAPSPPGYTEVVKEEPPPPQPMGNVPQFQPLQQAVQPQQYYAPQQSSYLNPQPLVQYPGGQQPVFMYPQQQAAVPGAVPVQQVQYVMPAAMPQMGVFQKPNYSPPHTFLVITIIVMIICSLFNITSLAFGVPALVMAIMAQDKLSSGDYPTASKRGTVALVLTIFNAAYTLVWAIIITASIVGTFCTDGYYYRYYCN